MDHIDNNDTKSSKVDPLLIHGLIYGINISKHSDLSPDDRIRIIKIVSEILIIVVWSASTCINSIFVPATHMFLSFSCYHVGTYTLDFFNATKKNTTYIVGKKFPYENNV